MTSDLLKMTIKGNFKNKDGGLQQAHRIKCKMFS